jgi:hypothetical protein
MKTSRLAATLLCACAAAGCAPSPGGPVAEPRPAAPGAGASPAPSRSAAPAADPGCTGGLTGTEPGVVRITCAGSATIRVRAGGVRKEFRGGECHSAGDVWSAAAGVVVDATGTHGTYTGRPVDSVAVNDTATHGKGTIQLVLGGKHYYDLGEAALTVAAGGRGAHLSGTSHRLSDAPGAKITADVTC